MDFIDDKNNLISGKYRYICRQELTAFYDKNSRENLEKIIAAKFERRNREFFTFGSLEEEIKKIAKVAGAEKVEIKKINDQKYRNLLPMAQSLIIYSETSGLLRDRLPAAESKYGAWLILPLERLMSS